MAIPIEFVDNSEQPQEDSRTSKGEQATLLQ